MSEIEHEYGGDVGVNPAAPPVPDPGTPPHLTVTAGVATASAAPVQSGVNGDGVD